MAKDVARSAESYAKEELLLSMLPAILLAKGFQRVVVRRIGAMKFLDVERSDGRAVTFWLKQGWSDTRDYSAIQFGMLGGVNPAANPDSVFIDFVATRTANAKERGATYALLVHMYDNRVTNYVVLPIDKVVEAYVAQIGGWPRRARATKMPTMFFEDSRNLPDAGYVDVVTAFEVPLEVLSGTKQGDGSQNKVGSKKITAEIEVRMAQAAFRMAVGARHGWKCAISGVALREVLDAAHLPDRDWRLHNEATDGILLRTDLHRLLDRGLAEIRDNLFWVAPGARVGPYLEFHNKPVTLD